MKKEYLWIIGGAIVLYLLYQNGTLGGSSTTGTTDSTAAGSSY